MANDVKSPLIISHRGASGVLPEHTIAAYTLAIEQGTDFIEPDLVISKDGVLLARHDIYLSTTTDVANHAKFADRKTFVPQLGRSDWLVYDFTMAELKQLRAIQPRENRDQSHNGKYEIPTFAEVIALAKTHNAKTGGNVGVYPETKQPKAFALKGLNFTDILLAELKANGADSGQLPVFIQSFDVDTLVELAPKTNLPLIYLLESANQQDLINSIKPHVGILTGLGPDKTTLMTSDGKASQLLLKAHELGLALHPWTFRDDAVGSGFESADDEYLAYMRLGIDGFFTDFTDTGVRLRKQFLEEKGE